MGRDIRERDERNKVRLRYRDRERDRERPRQTQRKGQSAECRETGHARTLMNAVVTGLSGSAYSRG